MKEKDVLRQISDYLTAKGIFWFRLNTGMAVLGEKKRIFRAHSLGPGAADILALPSRFPTDGCRALWIECKTNRGQQSKLQEDFQKRVEELGHLYVIARDILDLQDYL